MGNKYSGTAAKLQVSISGTFTEIAQTRDIKGPGMSANAIDVTTRDSASGHKEFVYGLREAGEVTLSLIFDPDLATHSFTASGGFGAYLIAGTIGSYKLFFPDTSPTVAAFSALVVKYEPTSPYDGAETAEVTLRITGAISWS